MLNVFGAAEVHEGLNRLQWKNLVTKLFESSATLEILEENKTGLVWANIQNVRVGNEHFKSKSLVVDKENCLYLSLQGSNSRLVESCFHCLELGSSSDPKIQLFVQPLRCSEILYQSLDSDDSLRLNEYDACMYYSAKVQLALFYLLHRVDPVSSLHTLSAVIASVGDRADSRSLSLLRELRLLAGTVLGHTALEFRAVNGSKVARAADNDNGVELSVSSLLDTCRQLERYVAQHMRPFSHIDNLLRKICYGVEKGDQSLTAAAAASAKYQPALTASESTDLAVSFVATLLGCGAAEVAAVHLLNALQLTADEPCVDALLRLIAGHESLQQLLKPANISFQDGAVLLATSANVRAVYTLRFILRQPAVHGVVRETALNAAMQAASPVMLTLAEAWALEATALRLMMLGTLHELKAQCAADVRFCLDPHSATSNVGARGLFLLAYQGIELVRRALDAPADTQLLLDWQVPHAYHALMMGSPLAQPLDPLRIAELALEPRKPRIAFLSFFFTRHSVGRLLAKIIAAVARSGEFDVHIVTQAPTQQRGEADDVDAFLRSVVPPSHWVYAPTSSITRSAEMLRSYGFDTVVFGDLFMHSFVAHLALLRLAPVQVAFWGHPFSSGYDAIDYFVTSDSFEPQRGRDSRAAQFSEQLVHFDSLSFELFDQEPMAEALPDEQSADYLHWREDWKDELLRLDAVAGSSQRAAFLSWLLFNCFDADELPLRVDAVVRSLTGQRGSAGAGVRVYGCVQSLMKHHPLFDEALLGVLQADPQAVIVLLRNNQQTVWQNLFLDRIRASADSRGVDLSRLWFVSPMKHKFYNLVVCSMDVVLDPFPFGGGVTLCDASGGHCRRTTKDGKEELYSVPFVTAGELQSVHRIGEGIAQHVYASSSADIPQYIAIATKLAHRDGNPRETSEIETAGANIFNDTSVADEWRTFLRRVSSQDWIIDFQDFG